MIQLDCRIKNLSFYVCAIANPDTTKQQYFGEQNSLKKNVPPWHETHED
jgi:hypothetical protein